MALSYFDEAVGGVEELWVTDGTVPGTKAVASLDSAAISDLTATGSRVFFAVDDGVNGQELWTSDGTAAGTVMVTDINPGSDGSFPSELTNVSGTLYFEATTARMALNSGSRTGPPPEP